MPWNNPQKLNVDDVVTAAWMNTNVRDNLNHLYTFSSVRGNSNTLQSQLFNGVSVAPNVGATFVYSSATGAFDMLIDGGEWMTRTIARARSTTPYFQVFVPNHIVGDAPPVYACALYNPASGEWYVGITVPNDGVPVTASVLLTTEFSSPAPTEFNISWFALSAYCRNRGASYRFNTIVERGTSIVLPQIIRRPYVIKFDGFVRVGVDNALIGIHSTTPKKRDWQTLSVAGTTVSASRVIGSREAIAGALFSYPVAFSGVALNGSTFDSLVADFNYSQDGSSITSRSICYTDYADYGAQGGLWVTTDATATFSSLSLNATVTML
jgi:hypothetical protein